MYDTTRLYSTKWFEEEVLNFHQHLVHITQREVHIYYLHHKFSKVWWHREVLLPSFQQLDTDENDNILTYRTVRERVKILLETICQLVGNWEKNVQEDAPRCPSGDSMVGIKQEIPFLGQCFLVVQKTTDDYRFLVEYKNIPKKCKSWAFGDICPNLVWVFVCLCVCMSAFFLVKIKKSAKKLKNILK